MNKILVTPRSLTKGGHPALELLKKAGYEVVFSTPGKQPDEDELMRLLPGCVGYLAGVEKVSSKVLEAAKGLKVISRNGTGVDNIDLEAATRLGVRICRAEGANAMGVAELTIGLMFALVRLITFHDDMMKKGKWERRKGCELRGRTLGLIGCGQIGKEVAVRALGLGMEVLAYRRNPDRGFSPSEKFRWVTFDELVERSHIISLHLPATPTGEPVITSGVIARMKKGVYLINTARASLIDEKAVLNALEEGQIAGFATDVYSEEPPKDLTLVKHERVISTPHLGGFTDESVDRATEEAVHNLLNSL
ncbi:MAG: phosphoglycerate dehydrogenase [Spirochaetota bacterium]